MIVRHRERHRTERIGWLRAAVLGANDGIVFTASLVVGVAAARASRSDILIAGVAELAWKKAVAGEIAADQAEPIVRNIGLPAFVSAFVESTRLRNRALALSSICHLDDRRFS